MDRTSPQAFDGPLESWRRAASACVNWTRPIGTRSGDFIAASNGFKALGAYFCNSRRGRFAPRVSRQRSPSLPARWIAHQLRLGEPIFQDRLVLHWVELGYPAEAHLVVFGEGLFRQNLV